MELRNPFGMRDNQIIMIEDLPKSQNGLRCNCVCPACKEPFEARMGDIRRHHFAHSGQGCDIVNAYMKGLYMILNEYLNSKNPMYLPPVIVDFDLSAYEYITESNVYDHVRLRSSSYDRDKEIQLFGSKKVVFDSAEIIENTLRKPIAILAQSYDRILAIRITPPDTVCRIGEVSKYKEYSTIEIDLSSAGELIQNSQKEQIFNFLNLNKSIYRWLHNTRIEEAFSQIYKRSKAYYDAAQERMKREAEELKAGLAKREVERPKMEQAKMEKASKSKDEMYAEGLAEVKQLFDIQKSLIRDKYGTRWIKCIICDSIKQDWEFSVYGGDQNNENLGKCRECIRNGRK